MKLTIDKEKEIVNHHENYCDIGPLGHAQIWQAMGFIEGWNKAIETVLHQVNYSSDVRKYAETLIKLKVEVKK